MDWLSFIICTSRDISWIILSFSLLKNKGKVKLKWWCQEWWHCKSSLGWFPILLAPNDEALANTFRCNWGRVKIINRSNTKWFFQPKHDKCANVTNHFEVAKTLEETRHGHYTQSVRTILGYQISEGNIDKKIEDGNHYLLESLFPNCYCYCYGDVSWMDLICDN